MDVLFGNVALAPEQELAKENQKKKNTKIYGKNYKTGRKNSKKLGEAYNSQEGQVDLKNLEDKILPWKKI